MERFDYLLLDPEQAPPPPGDTVLVTPRDNDGGTLYVIRLPVDKAARERCLEILAAVLTGLGPLVLGVSAPDPRHSHLQRVLTTKFQHSLRRKLDMDSVSDQWALTTLIRALGCLQQLSCDAPAARHFCSDIVCFNDMGDVAIVGIHPGVLSGAQPPLRYMSPEEARGEPATAASLAWKGACLAIECLGTSQERPYHEVPEGKELLAAVTCARPPGDALKPSLHVGGRLVLVPANVIEAIGDCFAYIPRMRPSLATLIGSLSHLARSADIRNVEFSDKFDFPAPPPRGAQ
jgi:hypothetical protein